MALLLVLLLSSMLLLLYMLCGAGVLNRLCGDCSGGGGANNCSCGGACWVGVGLSGSGTSDCNGFTLLALLHCSDDDSGSDDDDNVDDGGRDDGNGGCSSGGRRTVPCDSIKVPSVTLQ